MDVKFSNLTYSTSTNKLEVEVMLGSEPTGNLSVNVGLAPSTLYNPSGYRYAGLKFGVSWKSGDPTTKTLSIPVASAVSIEYVDLYFTDPVGNLTLGSSASAAIHVAGVAPVWFEVDSGNLIRGLNSDLDPAQTIYYLSDGTVVGGNTGTLVAGGDGQMVADPPPAGVPSLTYFEGDGAKEVFALNHALKPGTIPSATFATADGRVISLNYQKTSETQIQVTPDQVLDDGLRIYYSLRA